MALSRIWSYLILFSIAVGCYQYFSGDKNIFNDMVSEKKLKENEEFPVVKYFLLAPTSEVLNQSKLKKANWQQENNPFDCQYLLTENNNVDEVRKQLDQKLTNLEFISLQQLVSQKKSVSIFCSYGLTDNEQLLFDSLKMQQQFNVATSPFVSTTLVTGIANTDSLKSMFVGKLNRQKIIQANQVLLYLPKNIDGIFETAKFSITVVIGLIGILALFMGLLNIAEQAGGINLISRLISPFLNKLFPTIPVGHAAYGHMVMNFSANLLGLDNAATPFGLKAMQSLQEINPDKDKASDAQIMFLSLHAAGLTIIPVSIIAIRAANGSHNPNEVFIPLIFSTFVCTMTALLVTSFKQRINVLQPKLFLPLFSMTALIGVFVWFLKSLPAYGLETFSDAFSNGAILLVFLAVVLGGLYKKINLFDAFVEGAKGGFETAVRIIPYMVGMLVAVCMLRTSGAFELLITPIKNLIASSGMDAQWAEGIPVALLRPFSAGGARGFMIDAMRTYGADSFIGKLVSVLQGSSETTFYVVALYYGSVSIKDTRYSIPVMLLADLAGVIFSIGICYYLFG